jgi:hypothetical protein
MQADVESLLAQLFADAELRQRFLGDPLNVARQHGLSVEECQAVAAMPAEELRRAAQSFDYKRKCGRKSGHKSGRKPGRKPWRISWRRFQAIRGWLRRLGWPA